MSSRPWAPSRNVYKGRRMKVDAHPLLVAVALGLLGPAVLETEDDRDDSETSLTLKTGDLELGETTHDWDPGHAPDAAELHRVELEWNAAMAEWSKS